MIQYVGIPYKPMGRDQRGIDCWGLVMMVYRDWFGVELPDLAVDSHRAHIDTEELPIPVDGALVRVNRYPIADHWGIFWDGAVLHASHPSCCLVPIERFLRIHPQTSYYTVSF